MILETTFLVDLERELSRGIEGPAHQFLLAHAEARFSITFTIAGELASGGSMGARSRWEEFIAPYEVLGCTRDVCWHYGQAFRYLKANGLLIGANDLWIAATALASGVGVVTRDVGHYGRVPGLEVVGYATAS